MQQATNESKVQVAPDSTGANIRNLSVTTLVNGVPTTVLMQVIALADSNGNVIGEFADYNWQRDVIRELRGIRQLLSAQQRMFDPTAQPQQEGD